MPVKNSQKHIYLKSQLLNEINKSAQTKGVSTSEEIRRRLRNPPLPDEIILIRELIKLIRKNVSA